MFMLYECPIFVANLFLVATGKFFCSSMYVANECRKTLTLMPDGSPLKSGSFSKMRLKVRLENFWNELTLSKGGPLPLFCVNRYDRGFCLMLMMIVLINDFGISLLKNGGKKCEFLQSMMNI